MSEGWVFEANDSSLGGLGSDKFNVAELLETAHPLDLGLGKILSGAKQMGLANNELVPPLEFLGELLLITAGGMSIYNTIKGLILAQAAIETAEAVAEASVSAWIPGMQIPLALAVAASVAVYSGIQITSGQWQLPAIDISSGSQRAQATEKIRAVNG